MTPIWYQRFMLAILALGIAAMFCVALARAAHICPEVPPCEACPACPACVSECTAAESVEQLTARINNLLAHPCRVRLPRGPL